MRIGTAGWSIPRTSAVAFPADGSTLERYASRLDAAEINSSFYRSHKPETWARWAASVPDGFRFSVKLPKQATHERRLVECGDVIERFFGEVAPLGDKLGPVLVQLPPSLVFDVPLVLRFIQDIRDVGEVRLAFEPRHRSWAEADDFLADQKVARVAADPPRFESDAAPGGWQGLFYWRLHGSPDIYRSSYADRLPKLAEAMAGSTKSWCIFDNTMTGAATADALALQALELASGKAANRVQ